MADLVDRHELRLALEREEAIAKRVLGKSQDVDSWIHWASARIDNDREKLRGLRAEIERLSAPTGLTRERLDEIISDFKAEYGISEQEWRMLRVFRDAILAFTGKEQRSDCPAEFEHDHLKTEVFKFCPTCGTDLVVWQARQ